MAAARIRVTGSILDPADADKLTVALYERRVGGAGPNLNQPLQTHEITGDAAMLRKWIVVFGRLKADRLYLIRAELSRNGVADRFTSTRVFRTEA